VEFQTKRTSHQDQPHSILPVIPELMTANDAIKILASNETENLNPSVENTQSQALITIKNKIKDSPYSNQISI